MSYKISDFFNIKKKEIKNNVEIFLIELYKKRKTQFEQETDINKEYYSLLISPLLEKLIKQDYISIEKELYTEKRLNHSSVYRNIKDKQYYIDCFITPYIFALLFDDIELFKLLDRYNNKGNTVFLKEIATGLESAIFNHYKPYPEKIIDYIIENKIKIIFDRHQEKENFNLKNSSGLIQNYLLKKGCIENILIQNNDIHRFEELIQYKWYYKNSNALKYIIKQSKTKKDIQEWKSILAFFNNFEGNWDEILFSHLFKVINNPYNDKFFNTILNTPSQKEIFNRTLNHQVLATNGSLTKLAYIIDKRGQYNNKEVFENYRTNLLIAKQKQVVNTKIYQQFLSTTKKWILKIYNINPQTSYPALFDPNWGIISLLKNNNAEEQNEIGFQIEKIILKQNQTTKGERKKQIL